MATYNQVVDIYLRVASGGFSLEEDGRGQGYSEPLKLTLQLAINTPAPNNIRQVLNMLKTDGYLRGFRLDQRWVRGSYPRSEGHMEWYFRESETIVIDSAIAFVELHEGKEWLNEKVED